MSNQDPAIIQRLDALEEMLNKLRDELKVATDGLAELRRALDVPSAPTSQPSNRSMTGEDPLRDAFAASTDTKAFEDAEPQLTFDSIWDLTAPEPPDEQKP